MDCAARAINRDLVECDAEGPPGTKGKGWLMPRRIKLPFVRRRRDSEPNDPRAEDEHSETYSARLDRILDEPASSEPTEPETTRPQRRPHAAG